MNSFDFLMNQLNTGFYSIIHIEIEINKISNTLPKCRTTALIEFEKSKIVKDVQDCIILQNK